MENKSNSKTPYIKNSVWIEPNRQGQKRYALEKFEKTIERGYEETKKVIK